jgi:hypothetical protein
LLDGGIYMRPLVVCEDNRGLRGTAARFFHGLAIRAANIGDPQGIGVGMEITYGGIVYRAVKPLRTGGLNFAASNHYGLGVYSNFNSTTGEPEGPILFVPKS